MQLSHMGLFLTFPNKELRVGKFQGHIFLFLGVEQAKP